MKKVLLPLILLIFSSSLFAKHVNKYNAEKIGINYYRFISNQPHSQLVSTDFFMNGNDTSTALYYAFNISPIGFVIVAADDIVEPIIGYSTEVYYTQPSIEFTFKTFMENYAQQINYAVENNLPATAAISKKWNAYLSNNISKSKSGKSISMLCKSTWNQSSPYNNLCPTDLAQTGRAVTGCVATAMAQILKYWTYPQVGYGSYAYTPSGFSQQNVNFGNTTYEWHNSSNTGAGKNNAVALVNYHCGVAVDMNYGVSSSGAWVIGGAPCSESAYTSYFRYNPNTIAGVERFNYNDADWLKIIEDELDLRRPIQYVGYDPSPGGGGHSWVCDGYDVNDNLHMNWGWGGSYNGFFNLNAMNPSGVGIGGGSGTGGFNSGQQILYGIEPLNDTYETNLNNQGTYTCPLTFVSDSSNFNTQYANINKMNDTDYYKIVLPIGYKYLIKSGVYDKYFNQNEGGYTVDVDVLFKVDNAPWWNGAFDNYIDSFTAYGGQTIDYMVYPYTQYSMGSYKFHAQIYRLGASGIEEISFADLITLQPNPAQNNIQIKGIDVSKFNISIQNSIGQQLSNNTIVTNNSIDISTLPNGVYFLNIKNTSTNINKKFVVQH
ncbi:MAG: hypothetical protein RIQ33_1145 [Bacteroidota bacterium]|jgi:hypothetical protein